MSLLIKNGRLIDPAHAMDGKHDLYIDDRGFVAAVGKAPDGFQPARTIDAAGKIVCPGLVDLRARPREPGLEYKATIESEARAAVAAGITTLCCPPDTNPVIDTPAMAQMIQHRAWRFGLAFIHPLGALTQGLEGKRLADMEALDDAGCVGFTNALRPVTDTQVMRRAMEYCASFDLTVFLHSEDPWLRGRGCMHEGEVCARLGLPGIPEAAETAGVARDLALIEHTGVRAHFCGLSSARAVAMVAEAQRRGLPVSADVTAHHLHLTEHDIGYFNTQCHVLPPLRSARDRDALREALRNGAIGAICSDHQPHEPDAKLAPFAESEPGVSGLETLLPLTLRLVDEKLLDLAAALALLTAGPAAIIGVDAGQLGVGATADVCIFDPEARWVLSADAMVSRGRNSPFLGRELRGRVTHTLVGGKVVFER
ncbi:MAG: dihydroorotase [Candidatus Muproteobacteria bacterium RIFCSPHIGHO2_01_FULL_65_16]|uniref:Dihydroorotase n=2 Tax=Candidatus Muproteobacteria TaxID=1817795 RepID=A0A1F6TGL1_9PROT|nr:MAG: dihydroorotase [Candidatus Muproteobacteria bacterium RBG_16_65_31]OGI44716.1 MAG: dihydroorotase [Candidatus Muproteobacteria bacterium RIFCSPHIGHO2_01_FULL_65_16]